MKGKISITITLDGSRGRFSLRTDTAQEGSIEIVGRVDMTSDDRRLILECAELTGMTARNGRGGHFCKRGLSELTSALLCMMSRSAEGSLEVTDVSK